MLNAVGASNLQDSFRGAELMAVRKAYMQGLRTLLIVAIACGGIWRLLSLGSEWRKINGAQGSNAPEGAKGEGEKRTQGAGGDEI